MTLPELMKDSELQAKPKMMNVGAALRESIWQAMECNRLTSGLFECAKLLKCNPDNVMLCVLPEVSGHHDVTVDIQHTLIEAFCWENEIKLLKVEKHNSLGRVLEGRGGKETETGNMATSKVNNTAVDSSCVLLEYPKNCPSSNDEDVIEFHNSVMLSDTYPKPVIEFPE
ncbi:growth arrest and DNA damage-inducible protein GADD45 alpha-like [Haliotis rufescens]|uniref:growth arrest and DNA damage-inducible protein GADD45 alpha-like n=1 Tax=Haliotis rufescens TaxID=6454 RepID=UPI001EB0493D|nr:growth arrest and DNA damage-inducible protein GADD45 alpha-like [Haliotis rufescens]